MQYHKEKRIKEANEFELREDSFTDELIARLPYELTGAQKRALSEVKRDMRSPYVMQRLIQGDVGSGKTIIAFWRWQMPRTMITSRRSWRRRKCLPDSTMRRFRSCAKSLD